IYFTRLTGFDSIPTNELAAQNEFADSNASWLWASFDDLQSGTPFETPTGEHRTPPEDVLRLGSAAILHVSGS
ncbi:MAG: hypothetical protein HOD62_02170, partial [Chloroflexi bacterium]|nr:hypothetical protein [Chloroflexota bacterium]